MKSVLAITALALASAATIVVAAPDQGARAKGFERLRAADTNGDGLLSRAEATALPRLAERFEAIDANKDGQVSFEELRGARKGARSERFVKRLDTDGDGKVSKAEALAAAEARFARADADNDGFLTPEELRAVRMAKHGGHGHRGHHGGHRN